MAVEGCAVMVLGVEVCVTVEITGSSTEVAVTATEDCCSCRSPGRHHGLVVVVVSFLEEV